jgi:hypothetical protein
MTPKTLHDLPLLPVTSLATPVTLLHLLCFSIRDCLLFFRCARSTAHTVPYTWNAPSQMSEHLILPFLQEGAFHLSVKPLMTMAAPSLSSI